MNSFSSSPFRILVSHLGSSELEEAMEELEEEKKIRSMVEKQRDEALKSVEDLRDSLLDARNKNKVKKSSIERQTTA